MSVLWEIECDQTGITAVVSAESLNEMVEHLKRVGFKSVLTEEAQSRCIIDIMVAERSDGKTFSATEYDPATPIVHNVKTLQHIEEWAK